MEHSKNRRRSLALFVLLGISVLVLAMGCASLRTQHAKKDSPTDTRPPREDPAPLDPLSDEEQQEATNLAQRDPRVVEIVGSDPFVGAVLFVVPDKQRFEAEEAGRHAAVLLSARQGNQGARALVSLASMEVVQVDRVGAREVPFGQQELAVAWELAQEDDAVRSLLGSRADLYRVRREDEAFGAVEYEVQGMAVGGRADDRCAEHRCLALLFRHGDRYLEGVEVLVDLTTGESRDRRYSGESDEAKGDRQ